MTIKQTDATPAEAAAEDARRGTPEAIAKQARHADESTIRGAMVQSMAYLFVELVDQLIADNTIQATDFNQFPDSLSGGITRPTPETTGDVPGHV